MTRWFALLLGLLLVPFAALAGPVAVTSGEHPGFTRLVLQYAAAVNWQVGRTLDGYVLRVEGVRPAYDTAKAFDLIGKSRLAALWSDPKTGDLHIGIGCACYAMPFEFRPGIVVLDLHDGPPPRGSSFELPLDTPIPAVEPAVVAHTPEAAPAYDWTKLALSAHGSPSSAALGLDALTPLAPDLATVDSGLEPLRQSLIEEMSRGASEGIVDMAKPHHTADSGPSEGDPSVQIHLGETPDMVIRQKGENSGTLTAVGTICATDDQLDLASWGSDRPVWGQIGPERQGLTAEFDKPDPDAVTRAARFLIFVGFGAEARAMIRAFPDDLPDTAIWNSMGRILDDDPDPNPAFKGMEDCDTAAALWATLADPEARPRGETGTSAVLRNFSSLPPHLRRLLGPRLVDHFLAVGDMSVAIALRDSVLRAPGDPDPRIILMQAAMSRATGEHAKSEAQLEPLAHNPGPASGDALVALVEQRVALGQTVDFAQVQVLEELLKERKGGSEAPAYQRALILARAASGDIDRAFAESVESPDTESALWQVLAQSGSDSALLAHATLEDGVVPPLAAKASATIIADRLLNLGMADQAAQWVQLPDQAPVLLRARISLAQGKANDAMALLADDNTQAALAIKAQALQALNDDTAAAEVFATMGQPDEQWAAISRAKGWDAIAKDGPDVWKAVAGLVTNPAEADAGTGKVPTPVEVGPLARNKALVEQSAATRGAISALLDSVKAPAPPTQ